jgi:hypothetical protein
VPAKEISMPPRSYIITAVVLAVLVVISMPLTLGFSILLWYALFAAAGCILAVGGAFKIASGLGAPLWIGVALASPGFAWAGNKLFEMMSNIDLVIWAWFGMAARFAPLAAAAGALRLVETMSRPRTAFSVGYGFLAVLALLVGVGLMPHATIFTKTALYAMWTVAVAAMLVECAAFIGVAVMITVRRDVERWTGVVISSISVYLLYQAIRPYLGEYPADDVTFWLQPVVMLVGGAAVWRMGSVVRAQAFSEQSAQSSAIANTRPEAPNAGL